MNKPDLPNGNWKILTNSMWHLDNECYIGTESENGGAIVIESLPYQSQKDRELAQVISAIPEMVEDLKEDYNEWLNVKNNAKSEHLRERATNRLLELQQTFEKAGIMI